MPLLVELGLKVAVLLAALGVLGWRKWKGSPPATPQRLTLVLLLGLASWTNWGAFHEDGAFVHHWDQFHYVMSSKYAEELGYDGLYVATARAAQEDGRHVPPRIRDLRVQRVVNYAQVREHQGQVRARFSPARWEQFKHDLRAFELHPWVYLDHGYNAPPSLTALLRVFTTHLPVSITSLATYAWLDMMLLFGCVVLIWRSFGLRLAAQCALLLGVSFFGRYFWNGGSILRYDWLFAVTLAITQLEQERDACSGLALGYACAVRVFPGLLAIPVVAYFLGRGRAQGGPRRALHFVGGMSLCMALLFGYGAVANGRGPGAYVDMVDKLSVHDAAPPPNNVGLRTLLITSGENLDGALVDPASIYETNAIEDDYVERSDARRGLIGAGALACLVLGALAGARSRRPSAAALSGLIVIFGLTALTCYYWMTLMLLPLWSRARGFALGLATTAAMYIWGAIALFLPVFGLVERFNGALVFVPCAALVLLSLALAAHDGCTERA